MTTGNKPGDDQSLWDLDSPTQPAQDVRSKSRRELRAERESKKAAEEKVLAPSFDQILSGPADAAEKPEKSRAAAEERPAERVRNSEPKEARADRKTPQALKITAAAVIAAIACVGAGALLLNQRDSGEATKAPVTEGPTRGLGLPGVIEDEAGNVEFSAIVTGISPVGCVNAEGATVEPDNGRFVALDLTVATGDFASIVSQEVSLQRWTIEDGTSVVTGGAYLCVPDQLDKIGANQRSNGQVVIDIPTTETVVRFTAEDFSWKWTIPEGVPVSDLTSDGSWDPENSGVVDQMPETAPGPEEVVPEG